jgi:hypothetical protein
MDFRIGADPMNRLCPNLLVAGCLGIIIWAVASTLRAPGPPDVESDHVATVVLPPDDVTLPAAASESGSSTGRAKTVSGSRDTASTAGAALSDHATHTPTTPASPRIRRRAIDPTRPLPADRLGRVRLDWDALSATNFDEESRPIFPANLAEIDGKPVSLAGFMSPLDEIGSTSVFMLLEFPLGCFYCQTPEPTGIVLVELAKGRSTPILNTRINVTGALRLNRDDPEDFLFHVVNAEASEAN